MSSISSTTFFQSGTAAQFEYVLGLYPQVIKLKSENRYAGKKPEKLTKLDDWYQNTLPKLIQKRGKDAHLQHEELVQTMEWKQTRGKFFPQLTHLIKINTPRAVMMETKKAFRKLPNLEQALNALSNLKGVGITMASALLAAASPETAPFMADECLNAIPDFENIDYTAKEYLKFVTHIQSTQDRLNKEVHGTEPPTPAEESNGAEEPAPEANGESKPKKWTAHSVELALWTHYVASDLQPDLLKGMPESNGVTNGSISSNNAVEDDEDENSQNGAPPSDESNPASEEGSSTPAMITNGNADSLDGSEENGTAAAVPEEVVAAPANVPEVPVENAAAVAAPENLPESLDDCTKSGDSLDEPPAVEATAAAVATLCTTDSTDLVAAAAIDSDSQSSNSQKRPLYCDDNSEEQPELSAPKLIKL